MAAGHTLALDSKSLAQLLDGLDAKARPSADSESQPASQREFRYRARSLRITVQRNDAEQAPITVQARAIGWRTLSVLSPTGLYPQSTCQIQLVDVEGIQQEVRGRVASCKQLDEHPRIWDVRLDLAAAVDVARFAAEAWRARVLVADDSITIRRLMQRLLHMVHADTVCVADGREAVEAALSNRFDLVLLDVEMPEMSGIEAVSTLREKGYLWPIVFVTGLSDEEANRFLCTEAGCDAFVPKPIQLNALAELIRMAKPRPVVSTLANDPECFELVDGYFHELRDAVEQLEVAYQNTDLESINRLAHQIRIEAPSCGFASLARCATRVKNAIAYEFPLSDVRRALSDLLRNCLAARPAAGFAIEAAAQPAT